MTIPNDLKYTKSHEWVRAEADGTVTIGITQHAQDCWGHGVWKALKSGRKVAANEECGGRVGEGCIRCVCADCR